MAIILNTFALIAVTLNIWLVNKNFKEWQELRNERKELERAYEDLVMMRRISEKL